MKICHSGALAVFLDVLWLQNSQGRYTTLKNQRTTKQPVWSGILLPTYRLNERRRRWSECVGRCENGLGPSVVRYIFSCCRSYSAAMITELWLSNCNIFECMKCSDWDPPAHFKHKLHTMWLPVCFPAYKGLLKRLFSKMKEFEQILSFWSRSFFQTGSKTVLI